MPELSLAIWANIAEIVGAGSIVSGLIFGLFQIRHYRAQQRDAIAVMSRKLGRWQEDVRKSQGQPSWGEWFEWLAEQANKEKTETEPAHIRFRNWRP